MTTCTLGEQARIDLVRLIDTRLLVQANSGGGKSWLLRRLLEQTHGQIQHLVIDPEGEFASLRERFDYVHAAKQGGDTAADPRSAKLLAERLLELNVSAILDIYELKAHDRIRFVRAFLEALVDAPKRLWHPVLVVVDEAHVFCPQHGEAESAGAVIDLATRGRKRGYCAVLATQRLSKLHKDAAAELNNKLIGRTGLDVDMKRAGEELGFTTREQVHQLRALEAGEFYAFGPALSAEVRKVRIGAVKTSHPKAGARLTFTVPSPTAKIRNLLPQLADLPAEAEQRTKSLEELKREVTTLTRELERVKKAAPVAPAAPPAPPVEVPVLTPDHMQGLENIAGHFVDVANQVGKLIPVMREIQAGALEEVKQLLDKARAVSARRSIPAHVAHATPLPAKRSRAEAPTRAPNIPRSIPAGELPKPQQRILDALAWLESVQVQRGTRGQVAFLSDASPKSSAFANNLGALRTASLIQYPGPDLVQLTDQGRELAAGVDVPLTPEDLHDAITARLPRPQGRILEALIAMYPEPITKEQLAEAADASPTSSAYANNLGALRSLGFIDYPAPGQVVAKPVLFLES